MNIYDTFKTFNSKIRIKIGILSLTQILFIIIIFWILIYLQSQQTLMGNTINIAGKDRYLLSNILYQISEYTGQSTTTGEKNQINYNNISIIKSVEQQFDSNMMALKNGGNISNIKIEPIPTEFINKWNVIYQKWQNFKSVLEEQFYNNFQGKDQNFQNINPLITFNKNSIDSIKQQVYPLAFDLINSSDTLVTQLGHSEKKNMDDLVILQIAFGSMNVLLILFILLLVSQMLKPVSLLTNATSEVKKGNLNVSVNYRGDDEFAFLIGSFNSMIETIKNDIQKQTELTRQLKFLNAQLKIVNKAKDDFINTAAHELRGPIQSIIVSSSLLIEKVKDFDQRKLFDIVYRNSKKLKILIQNLLDDPKIESNSLRLNKEKFYLHEFLLDIIKDYENTYCYYHDYKFHLVTSENDDFLIDADNDRIAQVIYNIIDNSIRYIPEGGIISIISEKKKIYSNDGVLKEFVIINIKDSGTGIDTEILPKMFTKFATKSFQGTGLGLYISKNIIEAHGGKIWAKNNEDGKGATVSFSLPLTDNNYRK